MKGNRKAFTRIELIASIAALALLGALAAPLLGTTRSDSNEAACVNNLRQIGYAVRSWGDDHADRPPWLTPDSEGGTRPGAGGKVANAWFEFLFLSNQLVTPQILSCPADQTVKVASDWGNGSNGLAHPSQRANAISYFIGLHSFPERPLAAIAGDRNIRTSFGTACSPALVNNALGLRLDPPIDTDIGWTNEVHGAAGNLLKNDGSVEVTTSARLRIALSEDPAHADSTLHILRAR